MENQFCSICLRTGTRLFLFNASVHKTFIKNVIKSECDLISHENEHICYECKALLVKSYNFVQKATTAHIILQKMLKETENITIDVIKALNRNEFNLNTLTMHARGIDFYFTDNIEIGYEIDFTNVNVKVENALNNEDYAIMSDEDKEDIKVEFFDESECAVSPKKEKKEKRPKKKVTKIKKRKISKPQVTKPKNTVKKPKPPLEPSKFMQSLPFVAGKRPRKEVKYENMDVKGEKQKDNDNYQPSAESSDTNSIDLYNESGKQLVRDLRVFPMQCEECPVEILNKKQHHYHYMETHPKVPYPYRNMRPKGLLCPTCGRSFALNSRLEDHMRTHTQERNEECDICGKKFVRRVQLLRHRKRHDENIKYECDYCKKIFKTKLEMKTHVRIHSGHKPYKCHICGAGFAHNGNVGVHIRSKHQQAPSDNRQKNNSKPRKSRARKISSIDSENRIKDSPSTSNYEFEKTLDKRDNSLDQFEFFEHSTL